MAMRF
jgi:hypothetical protein